MNCIGIIPTRYHSIRFPGKPLANIRGKSMIQRVYEQAMKSKCLKKVIVATDDNRIVKQVKMFGGEVIRTSANHQSGTDRCSEVIRKLKEKYDVAVNIQGDEPFIHPGQIDLVVSCFQKKDVGIATIVKKIDDFRELFNPNVVKVVIDKNSYAIYFSRSPVPYFRGLPEHKWINKHLYYKHIGIYAYGAEALKKINVISPSLLEKAESLEQLRWIEYGFRIKTIVTKKESFGVDTPEDLLKIR